MRLCTDCQTRPEDKPPERARHPNAISRQLRACTRAEPIRSSRPVWHAHRKGREAAKLAVDAVHRPIFYLRRGSLI